MPLDALEKDRLRKKMAQRMAIFLEGGTTVTCVSSHYYEEGQLCELAQIDEKYNEFLVVKNRAQKKMRIALTNLKEMIRFKICEVDELSKWLEKLKELKLAHEKRKEELIKVREEERQRLGKKVIVRKRFNDTPINITKN
jgi:DNA repair ATPase RecN